MTNDNARDPAASLGTGAAVLSIALFLALAMSVAAGCARLPKPRTYIVRVYHPDGSIHREYRGVHAREPRVVNTYGGAAWVELGDRVIDSAAGWQIEVDRAGESDE